MKNNQKRKPTEVIVAIFVGIIFFCIHIAVLTLYQQHAEKKQVDYKVDAPVLIQMEELGFARTNVTQSTIESYQYQNEHALVYMLQIDSYKDDHYNSEDEDDGLSINIYTCKDKGFCEAYLKDLMVNGRKEDRRIKRAVLSYNSFYIDLVHINTNEIEKQMFALDLEQWQVDKGYAFYDYRAHPNDPSRFYNKLYLMKDERIIEIQISPKFEMNDDQVKVFSTLFERADELFEK